MQRKVKLILNPMADRGNAYLVANSLRPIVAKYGDADWNGTVYPTHAIELAYKAGLEGYDMVIAIGGDGTVHEVVNGLMRLPEEQRPILGVVPVGTGNDFAFAAGIPAKSDHALAYALNGEPQYVDIGKLTDEYGRTEYWDNTLGIGFDTVVTIRSKKVPLVRGFLSYFAAVVQTIVLNFNPAKLHIETDEGNLDIDALMTVFCNGPREGGGFIIAPDAKLDDGIIHYASVRKISRLMMFRILPEVMNGTHGRFSCVQMGVCRKLSLTSDKPLYIHTDGEVYTDFSTDIKKLSVEILPGALRVIKG